MAQIHSFMAGSVCMANFVIALLFARFYRRTRDRLFTVFSVAFILLAVNSLLLVFFNDENVRNPYFYCIRLLAFLCIIVAILDKNRKSPTI